MVASISTVAWVSMLRAVAAGRGELSVSSEPDLFVDGLACSDQPTAHALVRAGLIRSARPGGFGVRVPAVLCDPGEVFLRAAEALREGDLRSTAYRRRDVA